MRARVRDRGSEIASSRASIATASAVKRHASEYGIHIVVAVVIGTPKPMCTMPHAFRNTTLSRCRTATAHQGVVVKS